MKKPALSFIVFLSILFATPCEGQITKEELESALRDHQLTKSDIEDVLSRHRESIRKAELSRQRRRQEIEWGFQVYLDEIESNLGLQVNQTKVRALFEFLDKAPAGEKQNKDKNGTESQARAAMETTAWAPFRIGPEMELVGPVNLPHGSTSIWIGRSVLQHNRNAIPLPFFWAGYCEEGEWNHIIAVWNGHVLRKLPREVKAIQNHVLLQNSRQIHERWEEEFGFQEERDWKLRSGMVLRGKIVRYGDGDIEITTPDNHAPRRIKWNALDGTGQNAVFYYIWKNNLPVATRAFSLKNHRSEKNPVNVSVFASIVDTCFVKNKKTTLPQYGFLFMDQEKQAEIKVSHQNYRRFFKEDLVLISKYMNFLNTDR